MRTTISLLILLAATPMSAQVRTWVSTTGLDTNACTRTSPCRNFDAAMTAVASGGEVVALDSGGYGPTTVTKSVSIMSPEGVHAAIAPTTETAISVDAGSGMVVLRGLYLNAQGGTYGVALSSAASLHIENLVVSGFPLGIGIEPISGTTYCLVSDTTVRNGGNGLAALQDGDAGIVDLVVDRSRFVGNAGQAVFVGGGSRSLIRDCVVDGNGWGILVSATATGGSEATIERCSVSENLDKGIHVYTDPPDGAPKAMANLSNSVVHANRVAGIQASGPNSEVWISNSTISRNDVGVLQQTGSTVLSLVDNSIIGNGTELTGVLGTRSPL